MAEVVTLTQLQYAEPEKDARYRLYIYGQDGRHSGRQRFCNKPVHDEEITTEEARKRVKQAIAEKKEVRITDDGDMLVFHAAYGAILYPVPFEDFWSRV